jgi:hypothetical protein
VDSSGVNFKPNPGLQWVAVFCALSVWALGLLAVSPQLHAALHADANHADHTCAVTLFSHGADVCTGTTTLVCAPLFFVVEEGLGQPVSPVAEVPHRLPPGRGPPLS